MEERKAVRKQGSKEGEEGEKGTNEGVGNKS